MLYVKQLSQCSVSELQM